jgi:hypothetical protein
VRERLPREKDDRVFRDAGGIVGFRHRERVPRRGLDAVGGRRRVGVVRHGTPRIRHLADRGQRVWR